MRILLLVLFSVCVVLVNGVSDVIDLNPNLFKTQVLESEVPFFVEFFAPWCGHCQKLAPEWDKAATNLKGIVPLGKVDCTVHQALCGQYQVQGYPTIKIFSQKGKKVEDYQQARQAAAIVRAATDSLPQNNVVNIKDLSSLDSFLGTNSEIPHLLLFTTKSEVPPLLKSLATSFKGRVAVGQVREENNEVVQKYSVDSFPKIIVIKADEEPIIYDGAINPEELIQFVSSHAGETVSSAPPPPPPSRPKPVETSVSYVQITSDNIESICTGFCVIGFVDTDTSGETPQVQSEQKKLLDDISHSFQKDRKFKFGWVDKKSGDPLVKKFSLDPNEPALIVFNQKRSRFVKSEAFDFKSAFRSIEHVLTGDAHWENIIIDNNTYQPEL